MSKQRTKLLQLRVSDEERDTLRALAEREDMTIAQVVRRWIRETASKERKVGADQGAQLYAIQRAEDARALRKEEVRAHRDREPFAIEREETFAIQREEDARAHRDHEAIAIQREEDARAHRDDPLSANAAAMICPKKANGGPGRRAANGGA